MPWPQGHGKAVISSYLAANHETWRRGVVLSFASAGVQSVVAIIIVAITAVLLGATAKAIGLTVHLVEIVSYGLGREPTNLPGGRLARSAIPR